MPTSLQFIQEFIDYDKVESKVDSNWEAVNISPITMHMGIDINGWSGMTLIGRYGDESILTDVIMVDIEPNACVDD